jgi:hypothetical protein
MDFDNSLDAITPDIASLTITIGGTGSILIPSGSTAQRPPSGLAAGMLRWSTDTVSGGITGAVEVYTGVTNSWKQVQDLERLHQDPSQLLLHVYKSQMQMEFLETLQLILHQV